jgi:HK97 family phage major capsid protein
MLERVEAIHARNSRDMSAALGLIRPKDDPLPSLSEFIGFALSNRSDVSRFSTVAYISDAFERAGHAYRSPAAINIPQRAFLQAVRASQPYQTTVTHSGAELVETTRLDSEFIDALRPRSCVLTLGAQSAGGLVGDVMVPRMDSTSEAFWIGPGGSPVESGAITESEATFGNLTISPAQVGAYGKASRLFMRQIGSPLFDRTVASDMLQVIATAVDAAAYAVLTGNAPTGMTNAANVGTASGANFAYGTGVTALQTVANANGIVNRRTLGWVADVDSAALLAQRPKISGYPQYIWAGNVDTGSINGHQALSSTNAPDATAILGDWSQILLLSWGDEAPITVEFNPFSNFASGDVQFRVIVSANIAVRHGQSFLVLNGVT